MFGFSEDIPLETLNNRMIVWVCFSLNAASIVLEDEQSKIVIYNRNDFYLRGGIDEAEDYGLLALLGLTIEQSIIRSSALMEVRLSDGRTLKFYDGLNDLENYAFVIDGKEYII